MYVCKNKMMYVHMYACMCVYMHKTSTTRIELKLIHDYIVGYMYARVSIAIIMYTCNMYIFLLSSMTIQSIYLKPVHALHFYA